LGMSAILPNLFSVRFDEAGEVEDISMESKADVCAWSCKPPV